MADGAGSLFDLLRSSIPAPGSGLPRTFDTPQLPIIGGTAIVPVNPELEAQRLEVMGRRLPSGTAIPLPPIQTTQALQRNAREIGTDGPIYYAPPALLQQIGMAARQAGIPQIAGMLDLLEILDKPGSEYRRHMTLYPEDKKLPLAQQMARVQQMRGKPYQPKPGELGPSKYPERGLSYSDYAAGRGEKMPEYDKYGTTALGGTQGSSVKVRPASAPSSTTRAETRASGSVNTPRAETSRVPASQQPVSKQVSTNNQGRTQQPSPASVTRSQATTTTKPKTVQGQPQKQGRLPTVSPAQASNKATATQGTSQRVTQAEKPSATQKPTPVAKAEPSGEALSYFRKNKQSAGWDALGTAVSLVQSSLKPEKGGLKSRAEYDRLLRGSDNFKKLDGNEQQRVRQAFAQWMNEQTIFKGKA